MSLILVEYVWFWSSHNLKKKYIYSLILQSKTIHIHFHIEVWIKPYIHLVLSFMIQFLPYELEKLNIIWYIIETICHST